MRTPLFLLGVGLALLAFIGMFAYGIFSTNRAAIGKSVSVVVAARDIDAREPILPDMVTVTTLPASAVPPHAFQRAPDLAGYAAVVRIFKGEPISSNIVASSPDQLSAQTDAYLPIPTGYVAITIPTNEQQGVAGYPAPGDYIDILATLNTGLFSPASPRAVTKTVFTSVYILRIGQPSQSLPGQAPGVVSSLTVLMSLCDAQYLDWLITNSTLKYALLSYHNYVPTPPADPECPSTTAPSGIGPAEIDARWHFTKT
jgi:Flp pilus assembly protein CpaB